MHAQFIDYTFLYFAKLLYYYKYMHNQLLESACNLSMEMYSCIKVRIEKSAMTLLRCCGLTAILCDVCKYTQITQS